MKNNTLKYFLIIISLSFSILTTAQENNPLNKIISIHINDVTQEAALEYLIKINGVQLAYSNNFLLAEKKVTINSDSISVKSALNYILRGTNLKIRSVNGDNIVIAPEKNLIKGKITDEKTGEPLSAASVFLSGTTYGNATNKEGKYEIHSPPSGQYELVISMLGYDFEKRPVLLKGETELVIDVQLKQKDIELTPVEITEKRPESWYKNMEIFRRAFIGTSDFSEDCKIQNEEVIYFIENEEDSVFEVRTVKPLLLINNALGYKLHCIITNMTYNRVTKDALISAVTNFEELKAEDDDQLEEWKENREEAYKGSVIHFLVSLTKMSAGKEGFRIYSGVEKKLFHLRPGSLPKTVWQPTFQLFPELFFSYVASTKEYFFNINKLIIVYRDDISAFMIVSKDMCLDEYGYPKNDSLYKVAGVWAEKGIADLLPRFYELTLENNK